MSAGSETFDALLLRVGRLNYAWSNTESLLIHLIAGLAGTDKDTAVIIFLTLNTTRARIDLVERLAKMPRIPGEQRQRILALTGKVMKHSALRNRYSHSIYAFDPESGDARTILMRIADRKDDIKVGQSQAIDAAALSDVEAAIRDLAELNGDFWQLIRDFDYPA
ncbi:hypothetical protein ACFSUD_03865 [Sulfitobacter aestuarii]|uniref:MarR family transcriptional regulator n=1 Tax=Sulfitobacter aestuarii TaxID=2161676 RepID=A0ABW5U181_9RHOB